VFDEKGADVPAALIADDVDARSEFHAWSVAG
jgi:hypothetical protein